MAGDQLCLRYILLKNISEINDNNAKFLLNFFPESENENAFKKKTLLSFNLSRFYDVFRSVFRTQSII